MPNPTTAAYVAGLIDGEGCIGILHSGGTYAARVDVGMTVKAHAVLEGLLRAYGGSIRQNRAATQDWDAAEAWALQGRATVPFLREIAPYLRLKSEQARIALRVEEIVAELPKTRTGRSRWTEAARERCAVLKRRMHELNKKGPSTPSPASGSVIARLVAGQWVTDQSDLFSDLGWAPFSGPWPRSGSMRSGGASVRRTSAPRTAASASSSPPGLPTPTASDGKRATSSTRAREHHSARTLHEALLDLTA